MFIKCKINHIKGSYHSNHKYSVVPHVSLFSLMFLPKSDRWDTSQFEVDSGDEIDVISSSIVLIKISS